MADANGGAAASGMPEWIMECLRDAGVPRTASQIRVSLAARGRIEKGASKKDIGLNRYLQQLVAAGDVERSEDELPTFQSTKKERTSVDELRDLVNKNAEATLTMEQPKPTYGRDGDRYVCLVTFSWKLPSAMEVAIGNISRPRLHPREAERSACHGLLGKLCKDARLPPQLRKAARHLFYQAYCRGGTLALFAAYPNPDEEALLEFKGSAKHDDLCWTVKNALRSATSNAAYFAYALNSFVMKRTAFNPKMVLGVHDGTSRMHGVVLPNKGEVSSPVISSKRDQAREKIHQAVAQALRSSIDLQCDWQLNLDCHVDLLWAPSDLQEDQRVVITLILDASKVVTLAQKCSKWQGWFSWKGAKPHYRDGSHTTPVAEHDDSGLPQTRDGGHSPAPGPVLGDDGEGEDDTTVKDTHEDHKAKAQMIVKEEALKTLQRVRRKLEALEMMQELPVVTARPLIDMVAALHIEASLLVKEISRVQDHYAQAQTHNKRLVELFEARSTGGSESKEPVVERESKGPDDEEECGVADLGRGDDDADDEAHEL